MQLRSQIIYILVGIVIMTIALVSFVQYRSAKRVYLAEVQNHLHSLSNAKRLRFTGLVSKRKEQIIMLQTRELLNENLASYLQTGDRSTQLTLLRSLKMIKYRMSSFKEVHLVDMDGTVISSTASRYIGADFSERESYKHAARGEICLHETFYDRSKALTLMMAGMLDYEGRNIGIIMVEAEANDILSIINDYTGLGETGETTLARRIPEGRIYYITPTRFHSIPGDSLIRDQKSELAMELALRGKDGLQEAVDYRGEEVFAVPNYISEIGWGMVTKIDQAEATLPVRDLLYNTVLIALFFIALVAVLAYVLTGYLVKPIEQLCKATWDIAQGKHHRKVKYSGNNEVGRLAHNFNYMSDKLEETNQALTSKIEELNQSNDSLNRFAYIISHDLKSPVHSITGLMTFLRKKMAHNDNPEILKLITMTEQKADHMINLINGILSYSKAGTLEDKKEALELNKVISDLLPHLDAPDHIQVTVEPLPVIYFEKVLIIQVYQNLISNAIKYMDKPIGTVRIGHTQLDREHRFYVSDNGRGIDRKHFSKIFDLFNKTHRLEGVDSTGIGLSIVKRIIESRGGRIWVESEPGAGSTFFFTLPKEDIPTEPAHSQD